MVRNPVRINAEFDATDSNVLLIDKTQLSEIVVRIVKQLLEKKNSRYHLETDSKRAVENIIGQ